MSRRGRSLWVLGVGLAVAACTSGPPSTPRPVATSPPSCEAAPEAGAKGMAEVQGVGDGATVWALFFTGTGITATTEVKVAWRMSGDGELSMVATGPGGRTVRPVWGPEPHTSSSWSRPGDEWGTGWVFPSPGCWTIALTREEGRGHLSVRVGPATS